ncbi:MAG: glycosyltransferase family 4 protein [[Pasteurella] mairii]|uniref:Colanic acid biosynthesis glycosyltransferase WcaL n=1 Tax=[Pasteurella] mairii TaxID=757 RepID=A0A379B3Y0_9PAST|nr:glycosyltransferase family 4 protein [[Pasteurella] mairii]SUB32760.1 colanic acid biosynthesis glycosyltransferase WcaL [[Pasteurella] mairii]
MKYKIMVVGQIKNSKTGLGKSINDFIMFYQRKYGEETLYKLDITNNFEFIKNCYKILFIKCDKFYFTPSGSLGGNIRDSIYLFLMLLRKKKIITHFHNSSFKSIIESNFVINWINKLIYNKVHKVIVLGKKQEEMFSSIHLPKDKFRIVRNGIDENIFISEHELAKKHNSHPIKIVYFSNMLPEKGYEIVLSVAKEMKNDRNFHFYFSGRFFQSDLEEKFINEIKGLNNVSYINGVYGADKITFLSNMNIFILPSRYKDETLPISMLEAIANGLYIIVSNVGVISEVTNQSTTTLLDKIETDNIVSIIREKAKILSNLNYNVMYYKKNYLNEKILDSLISIVEE